MAVTSMANSSIRDFTKFNTMATTFTAGPFESRYLIIAGGGGGGAGDTFQVRGGGGGAGGYRCSVVGENSGGGASAETPISLTKGIHVITVGAGGNGGTAYNIAGTKGSDSVFSNVVSFGGGFGGSSDFPANPSTGGSGGGAGNGNLSVGANTITGALGTTNQGYAGGNGVAYSSDNASSGGGGGGAGAVGANAVTSTAGAGGNGVASSITGSSVTRAGGGGGGGGVTGGSGGTGGGGAGASANGVGTAGTTNTGGGGGGGAVTTSGTNVGGNGGSGFLVFTLPLQAVATFSAGVTQTNTVVGTNRVYTVTATSTTSETVTIG